MNQNIKWNKKEGKRRIIRDDNRHLLHERQEKNKNIFSDITRNPGHHYYRHDDCDVHALLSLDHSWPQVPFYADLIVSWAFASNLSIRILWKKEFLSWVIVYRTRTDLMICLLMHSSLVSHVFSSQSVFQEFPFRTTWKKQKEKRHHSQKSLCLLKRVEKEGEKTKRE